MRIHLILIAVTLGAALAENCSSTPSPVRIVPPRVPEGGRTLSLAVASTDVKRIVAATETGGLFRTFDGGKNWQHLDGLPNYQTRDVAVAFTNPNIIIATTWPSYRKINDGGIWRSLDGGASWSQPTGWAPPPGPNCTNRPGGDGISHLPLTKSFYVGTSCGIAVSHDNGATWSNFILDPSITGPLMHRVRSVLVINRTSGVAASDNGVFFIGQNGVWQKAQGVNTPNRVPVTHAFDAPYWGAPNVFFHASGLQTIHLSTNGGATWTQLNAPSNNNREAFVRVARSLSGDDRRFDVYYGDGVFLNRQEFTFNPLQGSGSWFRQKVDHPDPSDIAFDLERRIPVMLATDGGVHVTSSFGALWTLTGGGPGGFNALQVSEMTGQLVTGPSPHLDLYYATQDNGIKSSSDGGHTWSASPFAEGRTLRVDPTSTDHEGSGVTGLACGGCSTFVTDAHFQNVRGWPNAPAGTTGDASDAPFHIAKNSYLQFATNANTTPVTFDAFLTINAGSNWRKVFILPNKPMGVAMFSGSLTDPIAYQGVELSGAPPGGGKRWGMFRIQNVAGTATVTQIDTASIDAFGSVRTPISRRAVVGVDPANPNRLIAADVADEVMKFSADGGTTWFALNNLTQAVTDNGKYLFTVEDLSLATVIGWDPYDSCHILVGTTQNGVIRSTDGGNTWTKIPGSSRMTFVSSFYFPPTGTVWVSTNGRGLWNLSAINVSKCGHNVTGALSGCRFRNREVASSNANIPDFARGCISIQNQLFTFTPPA